MEQHPIPQNIASYEFRLVGDMTLKQFFQLAGGIIAALIIYRLPLYGIVRYPLAGLALFIGVAMAFIPLNGRPFGRWIVAFLRAIYSPTEYYWAVPTGPLPTNPSANIATPPAAAPIFASNIVTNSPPPSINTQPETLSTPKTEPVSTPTPPELPIEPKPEILPTENTPVFTSTPPIPTTPKPTTTEQTKEIFMALGKNGPPPASTTATNTNKVPSPERPNILTGIITNTVGNPVESTIIEIIDNNTGIPARALRTNRIGQFQIATPLPVGKYMIQAEKEGYIFDPVSVEINDTIIEPINILAKPVA